MGSFEIAGMGIALPATNLDNEELNDRFKLNADWIFSRTGIRNRKICVDENIVSLAIEASIKAICHANISPKDIDMILVATTSPDGFMPSIACRVQAAIENTNAFCFDVLAGCSGFINALDIADLYISTKRVNTALVIGAETLTKFTDYDDLNTAILFGDGAGAFILKANEYKKTVFEIQSDGTKAEDLTIYNNSTIKMNGINIYKFAVNVLYKTINSVLSKASLSLDDIKLIVPHQSNLKIIKGAADKLGINLDKFYTNLDRYGNTFCASIPIAFYEAHEQKKLEKKDKVLLIGYGGGLNWGACILEV